jgi:hypothetical protein
MFNLRRINTVGHMWPTRRPVSRAEGLNLKRVDALGLPCWDEANTKSLYAAEKKEIRAIGSRAQIEEATAPTISKISPAKLRENGPAKFIIKSKNHIIVKAGAFLRIPLFATKLREWVWS